MSEDKNTLESGDKVEEKTLDEVAELTKNIAIHEAKSAVYKLKLAKVVLTKGSKAAYTGIKLASLKTKTFINNRKK